VRGTLWRGLRAPSLWAWLALSALPPELFSRAMHWDVVDPPYLLVMLLWWPVDTLGRLAALRILLAAKDADAPWRSPWSALPAALSAEILLALRGTALLLAGFMPVLALASLLRPDQLVRWSFRCGLLILALLGMLPALLYTVRRLLAPLEILRKRLGAGAALDASEKRLRGRLKSFLWLAWPWLAAAWILDAAGLALPDWIALALALPSLAASVAPLALSEEL
jgi:hypothetical protein